MTFTPTGQAGGSVEYDPSKEGTVVEPTEKEIAELQKKTGSALANSELEQPSTEAAPEEKEEEKEEDPNVVGEILGGIGGGIIDFGEGVAGTAEGILTGQLLNPDFKPTWGQVPDEYEPQTNTWYGKIIRGGIEFGLGFAGTGGLGHLAKLNKLSTVLNNAKYARLGKVAEFLGRKSDYTKSAVSVFVSERSLESTINDELKGVFPWWTLTATNEQSSPLEKKAKHVLEDIGLGWAVSRLFSFRAGKAAAEALDNGTKKLVDVTEAELDELATLKQQIADMPPGLSTKKLQAQKRVYELQDKVDQVASSNPDGVAAKMEASIDEGQSNALREQVQLDLFDNGFTKSSPAVNPDFYDMIPEQGIRSTRQGNLYQHMKDRLAMASRGDLEAGRAARIASEAMIKRISRSNPELEKLVSNLAEEIQRGLEIPAGQNVGGLQTTLTGVKQLAVARYLDIQSTVPDLAGGNWDDIAKMLMEDSISVPNVMGGRTEVMNSANVMALEMLQYDLSTSVADLATGLHSVVNKVPMENRLNVLLDRVEASFNMNREAGEFAGSLLRARRGDNLTRNAANAATKLNKKKQLSEFMQNLRQVIKQDPEMTETFLRAFAESGGDVTSMEAMRRYASDMVFNWKSVVGTQGARSRFVDGLFNTLYNSILSAPKTMARAASGTGLLTVLRPLQIALGGATSGDRRMMAKGLHMAFDNMYGTIGEAWTLAGNTHKSLISNQAGPYVNQLVSPAESNYWRNLGRVIESSGTSAEKAMYRLTSTLQDFNNQSWVRYPSNAMATIDTFSKTLIGRQELKAQAFDAAWNASNGKVTKDMIRRYEDELRGAVFNKRGEVIDVSAEMAGKEAALQLPLTGKLGELESLLNRTPMLRPFFLFMKTGANAISVVSKHTPVLARFNDDVRAILSATPDNLDGVLKYGIDTPAKLAQARALTRGRIATGYMTVGAATGLYASGRLTGNGPADRELRNAWIRSGKWRPRSIKLGDKWVNYDGLEPFASFLALIADIGDNSSGLGEAATENMFRKAGYLIAMNLTNKSFLAGLQPLTDVLAFDGARSEVWAANLTNNFIPFSGLRNEIANVFHPGLRELERDFATTIANRNPILRGTLALQYDPLDGELVRSWDFPTRMWNSISPIQLSDGGDKTRELLMESGFDLSVTFSTDSYGNRLTPDQRSAMMKAMGDQRIDKQLAKLFADPQIKKEMEYYRDLRSRGVPGAQLDDPNNVPIKDSLMYRQIARIFRNAKRNAEAAMQKDFPELRQQGYRRRALKNRQQAGLTEKVDQLLKNTPTK
jgi:hypothetical protein